MARKRKCPNCGQTVFSPAGICQTCDTFTEGIGKASTPLENVEPDVILENKSNEKDIDNMKKFAPAAEILDKEKEGNTVDNKTEEMKKATTDKATDAKEQATAKATATQEAGKKSLGGDKNQDELFQNITPPNDEPPKGSFGKKAATGVAAVMLALGAGYGYTKYEESANEKNQVKLEQKMALAENHLDQLYLNEEKVFLSKNFDMTKLTDVTKEISAITDEKTKEDLLKQLDVVTEKVEKQGEINNLFQSPIMNGNELSKEALIKTDLEKVPAEIKKPKDDFEKLSNKAIGVANTQLKTITEVKDAMAKVIGKDGKRVKEATMADIEAAKKLVEPLADKQFKEKLTKQLENVEKSLKSGDNDTSKEKAKTSAEKAAEKAAKEKADADKVAADKAAKEKATTDKAEQEQADNNTTANNDAANNGATDNNGSNDNTNGATENANNNNNATTENNTVAGGGTLDHGANSDGGALVKDGVVIHGRTPGSTLEGDWSWAPGIQDNFINTAISRGYVTAGGYELRAKEIINGEAYYELYATRRDTALTQGFSDSQLPIYLVTVNAKTGSFRGGAANYSDAQ